MLNVSFQPREITPLHQPPQSRLHDNEKEVHDGTYITMELPNESIGESGPGRIGCELTADLVGRGWASNVRLHIWTCGEQSAGETFAKRRREVGALYPNDFDMGEWASEGGGQLTERGEVISRD